MITRRLVVLIACLFLGVISLGGIVMSRATFAHSTKQAWDTDDRCSLATLNGRYVFGSDGFLVVGSNHIPFANAGVSTYDGRGHVHGVFSESVNGKIASDVHFTATYTITPDCTVKETATVAGVTIHFDEFTTPSGNQLAFVQTDPGVVTAGIAPRGTAQREN